MTEELFTEDPELEAALRELARAEPRPVYRLQSRIGPYELGERIGEGGMGVVHRARDLRLGRIVALKLLPPHMTRDAARRALLMREAQAAAAIVHPNVTAVFDIGDADGIPYIAMELVRGETLRQELSRGPLSRERAMAYARQLAAGLDAAHAASVVHRDLKPENVIVDSTGTLKIVDFGLARAVVRGDDGVAHGQAHVTLAGCGTRRYMAPEQASGRGADTRADVYAFGRILGELFTDDRSRPRRPRERALAALAAACVADDPDERPTDGAALVAALDSLADARRVARARATKAAAAVGAAILVAVVGASARAGFAEATDPPREADVFALTSNSVEAPILADAISPDGSTVAYAERRGLFVRSVRGDAAAPRAVAMVSATSVGFAADGLSLVVTLAGGAAARVTLPDGKVLPLDVGHVDDASIAPDGSTLAIVDQGVLALVDLGRPHERRVIHRFDGIASGVAWSPSGRTLLLPIIARTIGAPCELVTFDVATGAMSTVVREPRLLQDVGEIAATFAGEDRLVVALAPTRSEEAVLREIGRDGATRRDLARIGRNAVSHLRASRDGSRLSFVRYKNQTDVYVADLDDDGSLSPLRRVTLSDDNERPSDFTSDGALLVVADAPQGHRVMRFDPDSGLGEALFPSAAWTTWAVAAPDEGVLAFRLEEQHANAAELSLVARTGVSRPLAKDVPVLGRGRPPPHDVALRCASTSCLMATRTTDGVLFSTVDPKTLDVEPLGAGLGLDPSWGFALSADGERIAIRERSSSAFAIVARDGTRVGEVPAPAGCVMQFSAFAAKDRALVATMICAANDANQIRLLPLDGGPSRMLATSAAAWFSHPVVSRDGRRLAVSEMPWTSNVYVADVSRLRR
ncbi:MAG: serine/threonine-protein kinase [Labilithrix sp.]|nr:serine/threonine-protein kinase [Labilithrix sp.]